MYRGGFLVPPEERESLIRMARGGTNECAYDERRGHQTPNTTVTTTGAELRSCVLS